jgi:hypothetical protein
MQAECSSEPPVNFYWAMRNYIPKDSVLIGHPWENLSQIL